MGSSFPGPHDASRADRFSLRTTRSLLCQHLSSAEGNCREKWRQDQLSVPHGSIRHLLRGLSSPPRPLVSPRRPAGPIHPGPPPSGSSISASRLLHLGQLRLSQPSPPNLPSPPAAGAGKTTSRCLRPGPECHTRCLSPPPRGWTSLLHGDTSPG